MVLVRQSKTVQMKKWGNEDMSETQAKYSPTLQINCSTDQEDKKRHVLLCDNHMAKGIPRLLERGEHS